MGGPVGTIERIVGGFVGRDAPIVAQGHRAMGRQGIAALQHDSRAARLPEAGPAGRRLARNATHLPVLGIRIESISGR